VQFFAGESGLVVCAEVRVGCAGWLLVNAD